MPDSLKEAMDILDAKGIQDYRRYQTMQRYLVVSAWEKNVPISGSFELTPLCNFDCKMCYVHLSRGQLNGQELLSVEQWKEIMSQAVEAGLMFAELTGGECLSYPGFTDVYLHLLSMGVQVTVLTNGSLITNEYIELFKTYTPSHIQITLYGSSEEAYKRVTGKEAFHKVIRNITALKEAGIPLLLTITPSRYMMEDARALKELVDRLDIPYAAGNMLLKAHEETGRRLEDFDITAEEAIEVTRLFAHKPVVQREVALSMGVSPMAADHGMPCGAGRNGYVITWNGEMTLCPTYRPVRVDVLQKGFHDAWRTVNEVARNYKIPDKCSICEYKTRCKRCPAEIEQLMESAGDISRICNRVRELTK